MWTRDAERPVPLWRPGAGADARAILAFTTRRGGVSAPPFDTLNLGRSTVDLPGAVRENRRRVLDALGLDPERIVTAGQVHGADVVRADLPGHVPGCDALVTTRAGLALAVTAADCMPLVFVAPGMVRSRTRAGAAPPRESSSRRSAPCAKPAASPPPMSRSISVPVFAVAVMRSARTLRQSSPPNRSGGTAIACDSIFPRWRARSSPPPGS